MASATTERWSYYLLMGSLPPMPPDYRVGRLPISRPRLEERLQKLQDDEYEELERLRDLIFWERQSMGIDDAHIAERFHAVYPTLENKVARQVAEFRMDVRVLIAAARRRRLGMAPLTGVGTWTPTIRRNWQEPGFGLGGRFPWVAKLERLLQHQSIDEANQLIMDVVYGQWSRMAAQHRFSFEAVILYVARWDVLDRWVNRSVDVGRERFDQLVTEAIGDYRGLF